SGKRPRPPGSPPAGEARHARGTPRSRPSPSYRKAGAERQVRGEELPDHHEDEGDVEEPGRGLVRLHPRGLQDERREDRGGEESERESRDAERGARKADPLRAREEGPGGERAEREDHERARSGEATRFAEETRAAGRDRRERDRRGGEDSVQREKPARQRAR